MCVKIESKHIIIVGTDNCDNVLLYNMTTINIPIQIKEYTHIMITLICLINGYGEEGM